MSSGIPANWRAFFEARAQQRQHADLDRRLVERGGADRLHPLREGRALLSFASNDYLGLASHPMQSTYVKAFMDLHGAGSGASRLVTGTHEAHAALEILLSRWLGAEDALVFPSGYQCNLGVISALAEGDTLILSDRLNHASLIDGCRLSRAEVRVFPHRDLAALEQQLADAGERRVLIVSDTLFSIDGDIADCARLSALAQQHGALLLLDDAHGIGCVGPEGAGVAAAAGVRAGGHVVVSGTLSKALGSQGGFIASDRVVRELVVNHARSFIFSTALSLPDVAMASFSLTLARSDEGQTRREHLRTLADTLREELRGLGRRISGDAHVQSLWFDQPRQALDLHEQLVRRGVLVPAIRPPTVPAGSSALRISLSAGHSLDEVATLLAALREAMSAT